MSLSSMSSSKIMRCGTGRWSSRVWIGGRKRRAISPPV
jgi:hypothetical protein